MWAYFPHYKVESEVLPDSREAGLYRWHKLTFSLNVVITSSPVVHSIGRSAIALTVQTAWRSQRMTLGRKEAHGSTRKRYRNGMKEVAILTEVVDEELAASGWIV